MAVTCEEMRCNAISFATAIELKVYDRGCDNKLGVSVFVKEMATSLGFCDLGTIEDV